LTRKPLLTSDVWSSAPTSVGNTPALGGNLLLTPQVTEAVLQLGQLNEEVVFRIQKWRTHRALEVKRQPLLNAAEPAALRQVQEEDQIKRYRSSQNAIATQEVDLDLHGIIESAKDVDVVLPFLVVSPGLVVMNMDLMVVGTVEILVEVGLQNIVEHRELTPFLGAEGGGVM
jgi:hypothetical protein